MSSGIVWPVLLSSRKVLGLEDPRGPIQKFKSSKIFEDWVGYHSMRNIKHHRLAVTEWWMSGLFAIVLRSGSSSCHLTVLPHSSVVVLQENPCPREFSRTKFQVLVLVLGHQVLVLVSQVLDNNTGCGHPTGHSKQLQLETPVFSDIHKNYVVPEKNE